MVVDFALEAALDHRRRCCLDHLEHPAGDEVAAVVLGCPVSRSDRALCVALQLSAGVSALAVLAASGVAGPARAAGAPAARDVCGLPLP